MKNYKRLLMAAIVITISLVMFNMPNRVHAAGKNPSMVNVHFYGDSKTSRGLTWSTDEDAQSHVEVVLKEKGNPDFSNAILYEGVTFSLLSEPSNKPSTFEYIHQVVVDGLSAGNTYYYRVGDKDLNIWSNVGEIETPEEGLDSFTFFHVSDIQSPSRYGIERFISVLTEAYKRYPDAKFLANTGDYVENRDYKEQWEWAFDMPKDILMKTTFASAPGNHDRDNHFFVSRFLTPHPEGIDTEHGSYFSFDYGNAHFTVLNTNDVNSTTGLNEDQKQFLIDDLEASNADWKIVLLHKGIYTTGNKINHDPEIRLMRDQIVPIMLENGVDIVLQGHDHVFMRTKPQLLNGMGVDQPEIVTEIYDGELQKYMLEPKGITYINSNTAGGGTYYDEIDYDTNFVHPAKSAQPRKQMFAAFTIEDNNLYYRAYTVQENEIDGQPDVVNLFDEFNIKKQIHKDLIKKIDAIEGSDSLTGDDFEYIQELLSDYNRLPEDAKDKVTNLETLISYNDDLKAKMRADVNNLIYTENETKQKSALFLVLAITIPVVSVGAVSSFILLKRRKKVI